MMMGRIRHEDVRERTVAALSQRFDLATAGIGLDFARAATGALAQRDNRLMNKRLFAAVAAGRISLSTAIGI
jgi:hypothetical protein